MIVSTRAVVISSIKYGDSNLIVRLFTETDGLKSYLLRGILKSKKGKLQKSLFLPLTLLQIIASHNTKGNLNSIKEAQLLYLYKSNHTDFKKQTILFFIAEVLSQIVKENSDIELFNFIKNALIWFDSNTSSNFHLLFMLRITKFLGIAPTLPKDKQYLYFDLQEGVFTNNIPAYQYISNEKLNLFIKLFGINFDTLTTIKFNSNQRQVILGILITYFEIHLIGFRKPKSIDILKTVFS